MKKLSYLFMLILSVLLFVSCGKNSKPKYNVLSPSGAPAIASAAFGSKYDVTTGAQPTDLQVAFASGDYDIITAPINLGVKLYNASKSSYKLLGVATWGNIYVASQRNISSVDDFDTIEAFGNGTINQLICDYVFETKTINYSYNTTIETSTQLLLDDKVYLVAEPQLSSAIKESSTEIHFLSVQDLYYEKTTLNSYPQAGIFVKSSLTDSEIEEIRDDITSYLADTKRVVSRAVAKKLLDKDIAADAISRSNIRFKKSTDAKEDIEYVININPQLFGGKNPADEFYI